ncbi:hypothetical protein ACF8MD_27860, partial [Pseudomonas sp. zjy_8]
VAKGLQSSPNILSAYDVLQTFQRHLPKSDHPHIRGMSPLGKSTDSEPIGSIRSTHTMELPCARY